MSNSEFFWLDKLTGTNSVLIAARHNKREFKDAESVPENIDAKRSSSNEILVGARTAREIAAHAKALMQRAGIYRPKRRDAVQCIEALFSLPIGSNVNSTDYFKDCVAWVAANFGGASNILSADIHRDESAPHCHVLILPLRDGRMMGSDMVGNVTRLKALWSDFSEVVALKYGLKRKVRLHGDLKRAGANAVLNDLKRRGDTVLRSHVWEQVRNCVQADPDPFMRALGIEVEVPRNRTRSFTQIMTSPGKGPKTEIKPIEKYKPAKQKTAKNDAIDDGSRWNSGLYATNHTFLPSIPHQNPIGSGESNHSSV